MQKQLQVSNIGISEIDVKKEWSELVNGIKTQIAKINIQANEGAEEFVGYLTKVNGGLACIRLGDKVQGYNELLNAIRKFDKCKEKSKQKSDVASECSLFRYNSLIILLWNITIMEAMVSNEQYLAKKGYESISVESGKLEVYRPVLWKYKQLYQDLKKHARKLDKLAEEELYERHNSFCTIAEYASNEVAAILRSPFRSLQDVVERAEVLKTISLGIPDDVSIIGSSDKLFASLIGVAIGMFIGGVIGGVLFSPAGIAPGFLIGACIGAAAGFLLSCAFNDWVTKRTRGALTREDRAAYTSVLDKNHGLLSLFKDMSKPLNQKEGESNSSGHRP
jgi:hypothetical protein